jgi:hypothetical protein
MRWAAPMGQSFKSKVATVMVTAIWAGAVAVIITDGAEAEGTDTITTKTFKQAASSLAPGSIIMAMLRTVCQKRRNRVIVSVSRDAGARRHPSATARPWRVRSA